MNTADRLHYEDIEIGKPFTFGAYEVTKEEIFEFARAYDPQAHHIDEEAAKKSLTKGLCASGWHTCAMFMRLIYDGMLKDSASLGAPGIEEVRWRQPVRPGDILKARCLPVDKRVMSSRPGVGIIRLKFEVMNQKDEVVMLSENAQFFRLRNPVPAKSKG